MVDTSHADHPIHGAIRIVALAMFFLGGLLWLADERRDGSHPLETSREAIPSGGAVLDLDDARMIKRLDERLRNSED